MDQLKEFLRQAIKHRFWIAVGLAALFSTIAYAVGSDPIKKKAEAETKNIQDAEKGVKQYANGVLPNHQYKGIVEKEKAVLSEDVNASWKKLYALQAPLLTWPETVAERFNTWGKKWPENVDASAVQLAIIDYVTAYPKHVTEVYQTFHPFDPIEGTGVVASPPEATLLKPSPFTIESPPDLGKVWAAQERLWIQRTLLQVVAEVNHNAKDWDSAIIKQLNLLEVGNTAAQDQVSIGKGDELEEAPAIAAPGAEAAAAAAPSDPTQAAMMGAMGQQQQAPTDSVFYIKNPSTQFKVLPVEISVLIDQDHIQDLLVALENSPMAIQVVEFEMAKPGTRVTKPKKGEGLNFGGNMMAMMYGGGGMMRSPGMQMSGFGGMVAQMPMMMGPSGFGGGGAGERKGVDRRSVNLAAKKKEALQAASKTVTHSIHDPYYYIVEMTVYGQARFYNPPPVEPAAEPSQAEAGATPADEAKKGEAEAKKGEAEPAKAEPAKEEPAKEEAAAKPESETPKAKDVPAKTEGETPKKDETPKAPAETPKAKEEAPAKAETPKAKEDVPKPKADAEPPKAK